MSAARTSYRGPVIDACVHHGCQSQHELVEYMGAGWQEYVEGTARRLGHLSSMPLFSTRPYERAGGERRAGLRQPSGPTSGADRAMVLDEWLDTEDGRQVEHAVLGFDEVIRTQSLPHLHLAREIARAANQWTLERWLDGQDARLRALLLVPCQQPDVAAADIRAAGRHPEIVGIAVGSSALNAPLGHPVYGPILEAAAELDLAVVVHVGGEDQNSLSPVSGAGIPTTYTEYRLLMAQPVMTHVVSLIGQGVFERFPRLRVLLVGCGVAWVPHLVWRFDMAYRALRRDSPWLTDDPSAYFRRNIRIGVSTLDAPSGAALFELLDAFGGLEDVLCFASRFPMWDAGGVGQLSRRVPRAWWSRFFYDNAAELFHLPASEHAGAAAPRRLP